MRYAVINNNIVENVIIWDGVSEYVTDAQLVLIEDQTVDIGYSYIDNEFIKPEEE